MTLQKSRMRQRRSRKKVAPTINLCPVPFKCVSVSRRQMGSYTFPDADNAVIEMNCRMHLKGTWPAPP
eukprot:10507115-Karenia_brevis.AAC.1